MRRVVLAAAFVLSGAAAPAQDAKPAVQPKVVPAQPAQPNPFTRGTTAARMLQLEEELETLEVHRDVKKAHVRAAELGVRAAELGVARLEKALAASAISKEDFETAKIQVELAKVQMEIRVAELKEVDVKIKYAKKRLEEARAAGVRPVPKAEPKPADKD